jgi:hypothetical protein
MTQFLPILEMALQERLFFNPLWTTECQLLASKLQKVAAVQSVVGYAIASLFFPVR